MISQHKHPGRVVCWVSGISKEHNVVLQLNTSHSQSYKMHGVAFDWQSSLICCNCPYWHLCLEYRLWSTFRNHDGMWYYNATDATFSIHHEIDWITFTKTANASVTSQVTLKQQQTVICSPCRSDTSWPWQHTHCTLLCGRTDGREHLPGNHRESSLFLLLLCCMIILKMYGWHENLCFSPHMTCSPYCPTPLQNNPVTNPAS